MKKTFFYFLAMFCCLSFCLVSCEPQDDDVVLPPGTVRLKALTSQYATGEDMGYSSASHNFLLMFATEEGEVIQGTPFGNGIIFGIG